MAPFFLEIDRSTLVCAYVINMVDFWGSLALPSMGDVDIFAFNSLNNGKIITSFI